MNKLGNCAVDLSAFIGKTTLPDNMQYRAMRRFAIIPRVSNGFLWMRWVIDVEATHIEGGWITLVSYTEEAFRRAY
jgi:hypothetical protein